MFNYKRDFGGLRAINWELLKYTWNFDKEKRARIEELREKYPQIVGFAEFEPNGHIDCFYCHHEWIGKGIISALMKEIL